MRTGFCRILHATVCGLIVAFQSAIFLPGLASAQEFELPGDKKQAEMEQAEMELATAENSEQASDDVSETSKIDSKMLSPFKLRSIGPALMSGRIADLAVDPVKPNTWYVAVGSGGVFKTVNAGTTWQPVFDNYGSYSIGCVAIDPGNRNTIWVGTGENVGGRHVGYGDGVYVSHNGGQSFKNMGLKDSEHISKILIHPDDSNVIFVASQGPLWSSGGERGLFKSTDGGSSWQVVLAKGEWTGVTDVVMDPDNPDTLYAATHQRHRTVAALLNGGPESGIHKSTDGGETWRELTRGIPGADKGKIGLAVSPQKPNVVYATIELAGRGGGFFRSDDYGESFTKMSDYLSGGTGPHYYQEIYADPHRFDVVYHANVQLGRTEDGGTTFNSVGNRNKHVDNHAVAFHPTDPDFVLVGCDGGLYRSNDYCDTYDYTENLPLTQFYKVDVDYDWPVYHVVGGTQDNNTQYGPARTLNNSGIRNADWRITIGGDGHDCAIDPNDPNIIYCESQQGYLRRFDRRTGESVDIRPQPGAGEDYFRFNWDSPIHISPHDNKRLYFASKVLHRSDDRGDSWRAVSGDLSRGMDRFKMQMMGRVWSIDAMWDLMAMSQYGNITSVSESPIEEGLIYVGTDDGLIQITEDGGETWTKVDKVYGVPEMFFVNDIKADRFDSNTVYACLDDHKTGDYSPYIIKSTDRGKTWELISDDIPERHLCWRIIQDHENPNLMFAGTEFGAMVTLDGGTKWHKLPGAPNIPFRDLEIQRRENDLVGATFGRGFYVLDDYAPLRELSNSVIDKEFQFFATRKALQYVPERILGGPRGSQGNSYFIAENPDFGAVLTYYLKEEFKTKKQMRAEKESKIKKDGGDNPHPGWEALREEDHDVSASLIFEFRDEAGNVVSRIDAPASAGMNRVAWGLQYAPFSATAGPRRFGGGGGSMVAPGTYSATAFVSDEEGTRQVGEPVEFEVELVSKGTLEGTDLVESRQFQSEVATLQQAVSAASNSLSEAMEEVDSATQAIKLSPSGDWDLLQQAHDLKKNLLDASDQLNGDDTKSTRYAIGAPSISSRISNALFGSMRNTYGPTTTNREQFEIAVGEYAEIKDQIQSLLTEDLEALRSAMDEAGVPWTSGRDIPDFN